MAVPSVGRLAADGTAPGDQPRRGGLSAQKLRPSPGQGAPGLRHPDRCWRGPSGCAAAKWPCFGWTTSTGAMVSSPFMARATVGTSCPCPTMWGKRSWMAAPRPTACCDCPAVFTRLLAPHRALSTRAVSGTVREACARAGIAPVGSHRLRHVVASETLRAGGTLTEIGQLLRHHSLAATSIYAKVDRLALAAVVQPWPSGAP